jgi:DNA-directed RNA polymerase II subunit RPB1
MSNLPFTYSNARLRRIKLLQFGVLSPDQIVSVYNMTLIIIVCKFEYTQREGSVTQKIVVNGQEIRAGITKVDRYIHGVPIYGGVHDPRMGTFDFTARCKTCDCTYSGNGSKVNDCPGHFGHIEV